MEIFALLCLAIAGGVLIGKASTTAKYERLLKFARFTDPKTGRIMRAGERPEV